MTRLTVFALNVVVWVAASGAVGWWFAARPWQSMLTPGPLTTLRRWETRRRYERLLRVRLWKDLLPEAGTWFGGISKRRLPTSAQGRLQRFFAESLRAERVHLVSATVITSTMAWTRGWWMLVTIAFAVIVNAPCIVVARYNRLRVAHLA